MYKLYTFIEQDRLPVKLWPAIVDVVASKDFNACYYGQKSSQSAIKSALDIWYRLLDHITFRKFIKRYQQNIWNLAALAGPKAETCIFPVRRISITLLRSAPPLLITKKACNFFHRGRIYFTWFSMDRQQRLVLILPWKMLLFSLRYCSTFLYRRQK